MFKKRKAVPVGLLLTTAALFLSYLPSAKAQQPTSQDLNELAFSCIVRIDQVYSDFKAKYPTATPQEIAEKVEKQFLNDAYEGAIKEPADISAQNFYTVKPPVDLKNSGINYSLVCFVAAKALKISGNLPKELLQDVGATNYIQQVKKGTHFAFSEPDMRTILENYVYPGHGFLNAVINQKRIPIYVFAARGFIGAIVDQKMSENQTNALMESVQAPAMQAVLDDPEKHPISDLPGFAGFGPQRAAAIMLGGSFKQPNSKDLILPGWGKVSEGKDKGKNVAAVVNSEFLAQVKQKAFRPTLSP